MSTETDSYKEAIDLLCSCAAQFLMENDDGSIHHSFMSTEEALCAFLVKVGRLKEEGRATFRWVKP